MVRGHPLLSQGPTTTIPDRTASSHASTPIPQAQSARYVLPLQTRHLPNGMYTSASVPAPSVSTYTPISSLYDAAPITRLDPTSIAHGAAASLPVPSSHPPGQDVKRVPLPQQHLPHDRVYATRALNMYAPQANSPYPPVPTHPHEY